jgi:hypothetical protein
MRNSKPKFLVSSSGRREAILLRLGEYRCLPDRIEDLEDATALYQAEKTSRRPIPHPEVRERLKRAGKL